MNKFIKIALATILITNPAVIIPMEPNLENPEDNAMQSEESCSLCLSDRPSTDFRQLGCSHRFCVECLKDLLRLGLDEEWAQAMAVRLRCPKRGCQYQMNEDDVQTISGDPARVARYREVLTYLFINTNPNFMHCPMANCEVVYELGPNAQTITCLGDCQAQYCSHCRQPHREGEPCQETGAPIQNNNNATNSKLTAEQKQQEWLRQNTKPCPQCRVNIEKNSGCNHMTCRNCHHEFCWECLVQWRGLQDPRYNEFAQTHQGYYTCGVAGENAQHHDNQAEPQETFDLLNQHLEREALHEVGGEYHAQNNNFNYIHAPMINNLINDDINIQDRDQRQERVPFPTLGAYFRQNNNAIRQEIINLIPAVANNNILDNNYHRIIEILELRNRNNNNNLVEILNHHVSNNNNIDGAAPQPLPTPHPIEALINHGAHPTPRSPINDGVRDSQVDDAWEPFPHVFIDGEDYSTRMNQFHADEAARRNQNHE